MSLWALRVYLACIAVMNLVWETLHLPLYTIGQAALFRAKLCRSALYGWRCFDRDQCACTGPAVGRG